MLLSFLCTTSKTFGKIGPHLPASPDVSSCMIYESRQRLKRPLITGTFFPEKRATKWKALFRKQYHARLKWKEVLAWENNGGHVGMSVVIISRKKRTVYYTDCSFPNCPFRTRTKAAVEKSIACCMNTARSSFFFSFFNRTILEGIEWGNEDIFSISHKL